MSWNTEHEVEFLKKLNGVVTEEGATHGLAKIDSDIDACEVILSLSDPRAPFERLQLLSARLQHRPVAIMPAKCGSLDEWHERYGHRFDP